MIKFSSMIAAILGLGLLLLATPDRADAGRLGGGGSFGSRPSYSRSFQMPSTPSPGATRQMPGSPLGGRSLGGGLLGGMLMGGLLGSLFFGSPFHGISFFDILLLGGGLILLTKLLRSRQMSPRETPYADRGPDPNRDAWSNLRSSANPSAPPAGPAVPPGFDTKEFLDGAKAAYTRLQGAWDARDLEDLRQFTSPEVFAEIGRQAASDPEPGKTEILLLEARLLEVKAIGNQTVATVLFDTMLRENSAASPAAQVREAWHFSRYETGGGSHWVVEGIQQLAQ